MNDPRTKIATLAVVLGLGGLAGYAMSQNQAPANVAAKAPVPSVQVVKRTVHVKPKPDKAAGAAGGSAPVASSAGTATYASSSTPAVQTSAPSSPPPVRTASSGGGGGGGGGGEHEGGENEGADD